MQPKIKQLVVSPKIKQLEVSNDRRIICISDIHGELDLFKRLLDKVGFCDDDVLVLLGDIFSKGSQIHACLKYVMQLAARPNVHILRGNCDYWAEDYFNADEVAWLEDLPHIIESEDFIFVHAGVSSQNLQEQTARFCVNNVAFLENATNFDKWVMTGHWPTVSYCHEVPSDSPVVDCEKRVIAIDGGNLVLPHGQLNAFIVKDGEFSWDYVDNLPKTTMKQAQVGQKGTLNITWLDRFVEILESGAEFSHVRHLAGGKVLSVPTNKIWQDNDGNFCSSELATDHWLAVDAGDVISVIETFSDRIFAKKNGEMGWIARDAANEI